MTASTTLGPVGFRISATGSAGLDWQKLDATWAVCGDEDVFTGGWLSDHLSDVSRERGGTAFEAFTTAAALAHRVAGKWIGIAVAANTFRHPALLAKQATVITYARAAAIAQLVTVFVIWMLSCNAIGIGMEQNIAEFINMQFGLSRIADA